MIDLTASVFSLIQNTNLNWNGDIIDLILHVDKYLGQIINHYGFWTYLILFVVVFCETGLVVNPFMLFVSISIAAILGDTVNYWMGHYVGPRVFKEKVRFLKREYLERTHSFYEKHGGKTIILARFIPIIRTFAPFVAGIGAMTYGKFISYNVIGGIVWVALFVYSGYFFGTLLVVKNNFSLVIIVIIILSIVPIVIELLKKRKK